MRTCSTCGREIFGMHQSIPAGEVCCRCYDEWMRPRPTPGFTVAPSRIDRAQEDHDHEQDRWNDRGGFPSLWPWER